jgi:cell wall-associated NlpC family hydrolase
MRSPARLLLVFAVFVAFSATCVPLVVLAAAGGSGGLGLPAATGGLGALAPADVPGASGVPGTGPAGASVPASGESAAAARALSWALAQLGTPYRWGGEGDGGFDCSGLVQAAFDAAGVRLPRVAQDQFDAGPHLAAGTALLPGDLVFFGSSALDVDHVGIVVSTGEMVDAPHTGAFVRVEPIFSDGYVGATRPAP